METEFKRGDLIVPWPDHDPVPVTRVRGEMVWFVDDSGCDDYVRSDVVARRANDAEIHEYRWAAEAAGAAVAKSATMLRQMAPGWALHIDLDELQMNDGAYCMLGQLYGEFVSGMEILFGCYDEVAAMDLGFVDGRTDRGVYVTYGHLQVAWEEAIAAELAEI